ncbi:hypothetical protein F5050DRAFT_1894417 [Lentinula boryana]|uniref:DUF6532 domain-containing protein n=1 Tax=Lentinula boryana TaxID=40481 RepID=A0ABQ8QFF7_9AGAR|nr:hypothetical protein F5050DRAFT_1894417 [Lentinula boryana]
MPVRLLTDCHSRAVNTTLSRLLLLTHSFSACPQRATRGIGGAAAQLAAVGDKISDPVQRSTRSRIGPMLDEQPANVMAPLLRSARSSRSRSNAPAAPNVSLPPLQQPQEPSMVINNLPPLPQEQYRPQGQSQDRWAYRLLLSEAETTWVVHNGFGNVDSIQLIAAKVQRLLENDDFLKDGKDAQGHTNTIAHPSLRTVILQHYFNPQSGIAHIFPDRFTTVPYPTLAFVMAVIANCIQEYDQGPRRRDIELSAAVYVETYACMLGLIEGVSQYAPDPYHSLKLRSNLEVWAQAGMWLYY